MLENKKKLVKRAPIVVVLGHIDHGKTSLLEAIKDLKIREKEAGGITQHIGAYEIEQNGQKITFIDTPGHEAFWAMRSRGAKVADIAILVIDATEGVMAQTKEAIRHIKEAKIPMIVALNKIDLPQADPERVKKQLDKEGVKVEALGGKIPAIEISAKTKEGISDLLEILILVAEMENLKANLEIPAQGVVIEAYLDSKRGPTATLLIRDGILKKNDILGTKSTFGTAKILEDFQKNPLKKAFPSQPVLVVGFEKVPQVGEEFFVFKNLKEAQAQIQEKKEQKVFPLQDFEGKKVLNLLIKADVLGSLEAIENVLRVLPQKEVALRILGKGVGKIVEKDIKLAKSAKAKILAFRVEPDFISKKLAQREKIQIFKFDLIYDLVKGVRNLIAKELEPKVVREDLGKVRILVVFKKEKNRQIVGGKVIEGEIFKGTKIEVFRQEEKIGEGKLVNLQKNKRDIERGVKGDEVGILYEGKGEIEKDDILVIFKEERKKIELI